MLDHVILCIHSIMTVFMNFVSKSFDTSFKDECSEENHDQNACVQNQTLLFHVGLDLRKPVFGSSTPDPS